MPNGNVQAVRFIAFILVAAAIYYAGISNEVYAVASPASITFHTVIRKVESVAAFVVVAATAAWWLGASRRLTAILIYGTAAYSGLIELGQRIEGSHESLAESAFDVLCGALGGYIVAAFVVFATRFSSRADRKRR